MIIAIKLKQNVKVKLIHVAVTLVFISHQRLCSAVSQQLDLEKLS